MGGRPLARAVAPLARSSQTGAIRDQCSLLEAPITEWHDEGVVAGTGLRAPVRADLTAEVGAEVGAEGRRQLADDGAAALSLRAVTRAPLRSEPKGAIEGSGPWPA